MGLLDSVIGAVTHQGQGAGGGGGQADLLNLVISMLASQGGGAGAASAGGGGISGGANMGGLGGLIDLVGKMQQGGLGDVVGSWIGHGQNQPISPDQLGGVLGQDTIAGMAGKLGMDHGDLLGQLSQMLPQVVDKLTPHGQMPTEGQAPDLGSLAGMLGGLMKTR